MATVAKTNPGKKKTAKQEQEELAAKLRGINMMQCETILKDAQSAALASRDATYQALGLSYDWYTRAQKVEGLIEDELGKNDPPIKLPRDGASQFGAVVKLVFGLTDPKYASRVNHYTSVLDYIARKAGEADPEQQFDDIGLAASFIESKGGVTVCVKKQKAWVAKQNAPNTELKEKVTAHLRQECVTVFQGRKSLATVTVPSVPTKEGLVLMIGRLNDKGAIEVVDTLEANDKDVFRFAEDKAFNDTSGLDSTLNVLGDSLSFANVFKDKPTLTIDKDGEKLWVSLGKEHAASVVIEAFPETWMLAGLSERASLSAKDRDWFRANVQGRPHRRLYSAALTENPESISELDLKNEITKDARKLHFNAMTPKTQGQVIPDDAQLSNLQFSITLSRAEIENLHANWLAPWSELEKKKAEDRVIIVEASKQGLTFEANGSKSFAFTMKTGIAEGEIYTLRVRGQELASIVSEIRANAGIKDMTVSGSDAGLLQIETRDAVTRYVISIPTVLSDHTAHNPKFFERLH